MNAPHAATGVRARGGSGPPAPAAAPLRTRRVLGPAALIYFYRRRLRAHGTQELLAGVGIAAAVALVLAAGISQGSITGSTRAVLRAVIGPANLQLRARSPQGFPEALLARVEAIPGVRQAAPLLERNVHLIGPSGAGASVYLAGTDLSLGVLDGLGRTLPLAAHDARPARDQRRHRQSPRDPYGEVGARRASGRRGAPRRARRRGPPRASRERRARQRSRRRARGRARGGDAAGEHAGSCSAHPGG